MELLIWKNVKKKGDAFKTTSTTANTGWELWYSELDVPWHINSIEIRRFSGHAWLLKLILRCPAYLTQLPLHQWPLLYGTTKDNSSHDGQPCLSCRVLFRSVWPGDMPSVSQWVCWSCSFSICQQAVGQSWTECFMFIALNGKSELLTLWNYSQATPLHPSSPRYPNINKCYAMCLCTFVVFLFNCLSFIL